MKIKQLIFAALILPIVGCSSNVVKEENPDVVNMIFETDMGNDVDDALALDMIYKYVDAGKVNLLGVTINKNGVYPAEFVDIMNTWYGYPETPIGIVRNGADCESDAVNYAKAACMLNKEDQTPMFERTLSDYDKLPDAHMLYRKILAAQPDNSVVVVSVGFSTNLARLMDTEGDQYSPLSGRDLIAKKVKYFSVMAATSSDLGFAEYNVVKDIKAAQKFFSESPVPIIASPFQVGIEINYPAQSIENDFKWVENHPMVEAYKSYLPMPYDRPTWDLTSVMITVEPVEEYFGITPKGTITIDDNGVSTFEENPEGLHQFLTVNPEQAEKAKNYMIELISSKPNNKK